MSRVLVTGARGFVGSRLVPLLLEAGHEVHGLSREAGEHREVTWHRGDLLGDPTGPVQLVRPDVLVHLAWVTEHGSFWSAPENRDWVDASLAMVRAFVASGGRRVVAAGTCAEYDWDTGAPVLREDAPIAPATPYGAAKDEVHRAAAGEADPAGVELAWGRVFFPYGPGEAPGRLVASVARRLLAGSPAETTDGTQVRDFIHVDDVAGAFAALVDSPVTGAVNVGTGHGVTVREVVEEIAAAAGRPDLLRVGAVPQRPGDPPAIVADATRLRSDVGFAPGTSLADGIAAVVESWRTP